MDSTNTPIPHDHIVSTEFEGGEGVLVDLNTKRYYQLNETAMFVWKHLEKKRALSEIVDEMIALYDVTRDHAAASIEKVISDLASKKLVHIEKQG